jgi:hypothetical protein
MSDPIANILRKQGRLTRENYLNLAYMGHPPNPLPAEIEGMLPEELQAPDDDMVPLVPQRVLRRRRYLRRRMQIVVKEQ